MSRVLGRVFAFSNPIPECLTLSCCYEDVEHDPPPLSFPRNALKSAVCDRAQPKDAGIDLVAVQGVLLADMALQNGAPGRDLSPATKRFRQAVFKTTFKKNKVQVRSLPALRNGKLVRFNAGRRVFVLRTGLMSQV